MDAAVNREVVVDRFARIFVLAVNAKINLGVIDEVISKSRMAYDLDRGIFNEIEGKTAKELFVEMFPHAPVIDDAPMEYNDVYWCGWAYMQLFFEYRKPIAYLLLTMPLSLMLSFYSVYHEMDISQLFERYKQETKSSTIMGRLIRRAHISSRELGERAGVSINTINQYRKSDESLYRAGFQQAYRLVLALDVSPDVLLRETLFAA